MLSVSFGGEAKLSDLGQTDKLTYHDMDGQTLPSALSPCFAVYNEKFLGILYNNFAVMLAGVSSVISIIPFFDFVWPNGSPTIKNEGGGL